MKIIIYDYDELTFQKSKWGGGARAGGEGPPAPLNTAVLYILCHVWSFGFLGLQSTKVCVCRAQLDIETALLKIEKRKPKKINIISLF